MRIRNLPTSAIHTLSGKIYPADIFKLHIYRSRISLLSSKPSPRLGKAVKQSWDLRLKVQKHTVGGLRKLSIETAFVNKSKVQAIFNSESHIQFFLLLQIENFWIKIHELPLHPDILFQSLGLLERNSLSIYFALQTYYSYPSKVYMFLLPSIQKCLSFPNNMHFLMTP